MMSLRLRRFAWGWLSLLLTTSRVFADPTPPPSSTPPIARKLILAGGIIGGIGYVGSAGISLAQLATPCGAETPNTCPSRGQYAWGLLPLAGPWIELGYSHDTGSSIALYAIPGALQLVGASLVIAGVVIKYRPRAR